MFDFDVIEADLVAHVSLVNDLPRTQSGKVQKFRLREQVRSGALVGTEVR